MDLDLGRASFKERAPPAADALSTEPRTIFLHVLSPSPEVPDKLTFPAIPVTTTVGELKNKIQDAIATKPSPGRQRLIYRGKALVKITDTMKDVFGQETIDDPVAHSLHLVLPPSNGTPPSAPADTTASSSFSTSTPSRSLRGAPRIASQEQLLSLARNQADNGQQPVPAGTIGTLQGHQLPIHNEHNSFPNAQGHIPPHIQAAMNSHFAALNQQLGQQLAMGTMTPSAMPAQLVQSNHLHQLPTSTQPSFQQFIAQQQQARAAAGMQGLADVSRTDSSQAQVQTPDQATPPTPPQNTSRNINLLASDAQAVNSNNWHITVNGSTRTIPTAHAGYGSTAGANTVFTAPQGAMSDLASAVSLSLAGYPGAAAQTNPTASQSHAVGVETSGQVHVEVTETVEQGRTELDGLLASGSVPSEHRINAVPSQLREMRSDRNLLPESFERVLDTHSSNSFSRASQVGRDFAGDDALSDNVTQTAASTSDSVDSIVYLLLSPSGPLALVVSPSGLYGTIPRVIPFPNESGPLTASFQQRHGNRPQVINRVEDFRSQQPARHGPPNLAQPVAQDQAPARDLAHILLPFGGHLWLFIRLFGFVYFFTPGGGWRRAAVFAGLAFVILFIQSDYFRPIYQAALEPFRRHVEDLVPLAASGRRNIRGAQGADALGGGNEAQAAVAQVPDVQQAAERLLREREQRDFRVVRQYLRSFERAVAIFFASLVPGIGERHIAARDTAEAVRLIEEVEREVRGARRDQRAERPGAEDSDQPGLSTNAEPNDRNEEDRRVTHDQPQEVEI